MEKAAQPAAQRLRERLARVSSGVNPTIMTNAAIVGSAKIPGWDWIWPDLPTRWCVNLVRSCAQCWERFGRNPTDCSTRPQARQNRQYAKVTAKAT